MDRLPEVTFIKPTPYQQLMDIWQRFYSLNDLAKKDMGGYLNAQDLKEFMTTGAAVQSMIDDLPRHLWWAIWKSRGISKCWSFPTVNLVDAILEAEVILTEKMQHHIDTKQYFRL